MNAAWLRHLPDFIRVHLDGRSVLQSIIGNTGWLAIDRIVRLGLSVIVSIALARYLGPDQFGIYSYALAFVGIFSSLASFGLDSILVRELVNHPDKSEKILGTALAIKLMGGVAAMLVALVAVMQVRPYDDLILMLVAIAGLGYVFQAGDVVDAWNQSRQQNKPSVLIRLIVTGGMSLLKLTLILKGYSVGMIMLVAALEALIISAAFIVYGSRHHVRFLGAFSSDVARSLITLSWPFIFSGMAIAIYMRIDQVMIGSILSDSDVGNYGAAARLSEVWYFLPSTIVLAAQPTLLRIYKKSSQRFMHLLERLIAFLCWLAIVIAVVCAVFSERLIGYIYGEAFLSAASILVVHIWSGIFVFIGLAATVWMLANGYTKFSLFQTVLGAIINVFLNLVLIPEYGAVGAAWATLIAYAVVNFLINGLFGFSRPLFILIAKAMVLSQFWSGIRKIVLR